MNNDKKRCCYGGLKTKEQCASCGAWGTHLADIAERATPAAASAGAAGTIDTPEFWAHLHQFPMSERAKADLVAHIDQHTAAAVAEARIAARREIYEMAVAERAAMAERGELRAATAPVSAAPRYPVSVEMLMEVIDNFKFTDPESGVQMFDELGFANEIGRRVLKAAGAPVSAAEPDQYAQGFNDALAGALEACERLPDWRGGGWETVDVRAILAPHPTAQTDANNPQTRMDAHPKPLLDAPTYRLALGWESARIEPDPAGEWVKRADLAMGQAQGDALLAEIEKILTGIDTDDSSNPDGWWEYSEGVAFGARVLAKIRALFAAKQAGKES